MPFLQQFHKHNKTIVFITIYERHKYNLDALLLILHSVLAAKWPLVKNKHENCLWTNASKICSIAIQNNLMNDHLHALAQCLDMGLHLPYIIISNSIPDQKPLRIVDSLRRKRNKNENSNSPTDFHPDLLKPVAQSIELILIYFQ